MLLAVELMFPWHYKFLKDYHANLFFPILKFATTLKAPNSKMATTFLLSMERAPLYLFIEEKNHAAANNQCETGRDYNVHDGV